MHTLCLPTSASVSDIINSADQQAVLGMLVKFGKFSSNEIRKTQNEHLIIICQNLVGCSCEFKAISVLAGNLNSVLSYLITTIFRKID